MDGTDSTRPDLPAGLPDADPSASSGPRYRAIVPGTSLPPALAGEDSDSAAHVRVTVCYSTGCTRTALLRGLDGDERRIVISCPWGQDAARTVAAIWNQLTPAEQAEVSEAFGLNSP